MNLLRKEVLEKYKMAKEAICLCESTKLASVISDRIPNYSANSMEFGAYNKDQFTAFFIDMRNSTKRAYSIGPIKTFLTIHAIMPAMIYVIEEYKGTVIDLPGDGAMALFKENNNICWNCDGTYLNHQSLAVECGRVLMEAIFKVVNPLLASDDIPATAFGIGIDSGDVIVTKTGTGRTFDTKAIGDCVNNASKLSTGFDEIRITDRVYEGIPEQLTSRCYWNYAGNYYSLR